MPPVAPHVAEETKRKNEIKMLEGQLERLKYEQYCYENNLVPEAPPKEEYKKGPIEQFLYTFLFCMFWGYVLYSLFKS